MAGGTRHKAKKSRRAGKGDAFFKEEVKSRSK
jgi:hypothetical protein